VYCWRAAVPQVSSCTAGTACNACTAHVLSAQLRSGSCEGCTAGYFCASCERLSSACTAHGCAPVSPENGIKGCCISSKCLHCLLHRGSVYTCHRSAASACCCCCFRNLQRHSEVLLECLPGLWQAAGTNKLQLPLNLPASAAAKLQQTLAGAAGILQRLVSSYCREVGALVAALSAVGPLREALLAAAEVGLRMSARCFVVYDIDSVIRRAAECLCLPWIVTSFSMPCCRILTPLNASAVSSVADSLCTGLCELLHCRSLLILTTQQMQVHEAIAVMLEAVQGVSGQIMCTHQTSCRSCLSTVFDMLCKCPPPPPAWLYRSLLTPSSN
jgi:hypothetical protein